VVLIILLVTRFREGAWIIAVAIVGLIFVFRRIHSHYEEVAASLTLDGIKPFPLHSQTYESKNLVPVVVLVNSFNRASLQAIEYAIRFSDNVRVCTIETDPDSTERLKKRWQQWAIDLPLDIVESPLREIGRPLVNYLHDCDRKNSDELVPTVVVIPEFVVSLWWERFLHNQTTVAIRAALYRDQIAHGRGRPVINVPYRIGDDLYEPILDDVPDEPLPPDEEQEHQVVYTTHESLRG
jgi:hypothetical protein